MVPPASLDGAHWDFSLAVYGEPDVAKTCLELQSAFNVDVNVLLLIGWATAGGRNMSAADVAKLDRDIRDWRDDVVIKLRGLRIALKGMTPPPLVDQGHVSQLREEIKGAELAAEKIEQAAIAAWLAQDGREVRPRAGDMAARVRAALLRVVAHFAGRDESELGDFPGRHLESLVTAICRHGGAHKVQR